MAADRKKLFNKLIALFFWLVGFSLLSRSLCLWQDLEYLFLVLVTNKTGISGPGVGTSDMPLFSSYADTPRQVQGMGKVWHIENSNIFFERTYL